MAEATAKEIADGILAFCHKHGDPISNLKLQKLVYYAQAWYLARCRSPLFDDRLEAWVHGPVQPDLYHSLKHFGSLPINNPGSANLSLDLKRHIVEVMKAYGSLSAFDLERLTHSEPPWKIARNGLPPDESCTTAIGLGEMMEYYGGKLRGQA